MNGLRWQVLACVWILAFGQAVSIAHLHLDSLPDPDCVVCNQTDSPPALTASVVPHAFLPAPGHAAIAQAVSWSSCYTTFYLARAPPFRLTT